MSICERCGTQFQPQAGGEVASTRVLCPACAKARAAEKLRAKAVVPAGQRASAPASSAVMPKPVPAVRKVPPAAPPPTPKPAPRQSARASRVVEEDEDEAPRVRMLSPKEREKRTMMIGWIAAGLVALGTGITVLIIYNKNETTRKIEEAKVAEQTRIVEHLRKLSASSATEDAAKLIADAEAERATWGDKDNAGEITTMMAKAKNLIEHEKLHSEMLKNMDAVETGVKTATEQSPDKVADLRRLLGEIEPTADTLGSDFVARTKTARLQLNRAYAEVLHKDAKDYAEANADKGKLALARYTKAEDEIIKLLDEAAKLKPKVKELTDFYEGHYKEIISESDELVTATYPDAAIEKLPWKDLLAGEQATFWNAAQVQGFSHAIQAGVLTLIGPDANAKNMGLISIGDREQWRDFVVNMDFALESGDFKLFLRLGQRADSTVAQVNFKTGTEAGNIVAGKKYSVTIKMIGSLVTMTYYPEDQQYEPVKTSWTWSRRGALGFSLSPETRLTVSRLRVKELRASSK